jgi:hypothetical protein
MKMDKTRRPIDALPPVRVRPKQKSRVILPNDAKAQPLAWRGQMPSANRTTSPPPAGRDAQRVRAMIAAAKRE